MIMDKAQLIAKEDLNMGWIADRFCVGRRFAFVGSLSTYLYVGRCDGRFFIHAYHDGKLAWSRTFGAAISM